MNEILEKILTVWFGILGVGTVLAVLTGIGALWGVVAAKFGGMAAYPSLWAMPIIGLCGVLYAFMLTVGVMAAGRWILKQLRARF